jgi:tellurite resistance protein
MSNESSRLNNFPVSFFSVTMGLSGFTIAAQKVEMLLGVNNKGSSLLLGLTMVVFIVLIISYFLKIVSYTSEVRKEFFHPVRLNFFPAISISMILISIALLPVSNSISKYLWWTGTIIHLYFTLTILSIWIQHTKFEITHMSPAWFIPVVGNILVPIAGVHHVNIELCWLFFSTGLIFWVILFSIVMNRIIFHAPLAQRMIPTLFIMIAPPAVGFISYIKMTDSLDSSSRLLYYFALFLTMLLLFQAKMFIKLKFFISWWAFSFPLAAMTIATVVMFTKTNVLFFNYLAIGLFTLLSGVVITLTIRTIVAITKKEICVEE